jgi:peptidoglycan-associated lipoprotein
LVPLVAWVGCAHHSQAKRDAPAAERNGASSATANAAATPAGPACSSDTDCGAAQLCINNRCQNITAGMAECRAASVHFGFDSSLLTTADRDSLERGARCLKADQALHEQIEGNADERGTEEYNLALGDRRANAVASYLEALGVSARQLRTVSYGKERPVCAEHDEGCWSKNRRADLNLAMSR